MRCIRTSALGVACAAAVLGGCASTPARRGSEAEGACINKREINSIRALGDEHVFVKLSARRFYLFTVGKECRGLRLARAIALEDSGARVCGDGSNLVSFDDPTVGPTRCRIERIEPVASKAEALDLIESRKPQE